MVAKSIGPLNSSTIRTRDIYGNAVVRGDAYSICTSFFFMSCMHVFLIVCLLLTCLFTFLFLCLPAYLPTCLPACLPACLPTYPPACLPSYQSANVFDFLSARSRVSLLLYPMTHLLTIVPSSLNPQLFQHSICFHVFSYHVTYYSKTTSYAPPLSSHYFIRHFNV